MRSLSLFSALLTLELVASHFSSSIVRSEQIAVIHCKLHHDAAYDVLFSSKDSRELDGANGLLVRGQIDLAALEAR